ncbi:acylase [Rhodocaloribacter sp.]
MKRTLRTLFFLLALVAGLMWLNARETLPPGLADAAARYDARILRDAWGVPHVFGKTDADAAYGLAYAHAEDDFATIQGALLAARGRLASVYGQEAAPNDYMVHLLRVWDVVAGGYPRLDSTTRALCEAYADGLNHYAALHPDAALPSLYPVTGRDVVAGFVHKLPLFFGIDRVLRELFGDERARDVSPRSEAAAWTRFSDRRLGSNAFAVAPSRTADGSTFLAVNSHQPWTGPVAWYEAHLHSEEGWDVVGATFPGAPLMLHGHNPDLGWAHTVNTPDLIDVYVLDVDPENPDRYRFDGVWRTLEKREAPIEVKLWGPFSWTFKREVLWSVYGPVVRRPHGVYALRFAGFGEVGQVQQWYRMNKARTFEAWRQAMAARAVPMFNTVYADRRGRIYYVYNARLPVRSENYDWRAYLPGDTSETLWTETLPFDALPQVLDPASGFLQSTNGSPFRATLGPDNPDPTAFSSTFGIEADKMTNRGLRALALFGADDAITWDAFVTYKYDVTYAPESRVARMRRQLLQAPVPADTLTRRALAEIRKWDLRADSANTRAAPALLTFRPYVEAYGTTVPADTLMRRLRRAAGLLRAHFGTLTPPWKDVNRLRRGDVDLGLGGAPDVLRAVNGTLQPDGRFAGTAGDSYILLVAWDAEGRVRSESIHQFGSATLDASSPHYADQARLFVRNERKPVWRGEAEIRAHLERAYRPGEEQPPR